MTRFANLFRRTAVDNLNFHFGEQVIYHSVIEIDGEEVAQDRPIVARVDRRVNQATEFDASFPYVVVTVKDDCQRGISLKELNTARDEISVSLRVGLDPERRPIAQVIQTNAGEFQLVVR